MTYTPETNFNQTFWDRLRDFPNWLRDFVTGSRTSEVDPLVRARRVAGDTEALAGMERELRGQARTPGELAEINSYLRLIAAQRDAEQRSKRAELKKEFEYFGDVDERRQTNLLNRQLAGQMALQRLQGDQSYREALLNLKGQLALGNLNYRGLDLTSGRQLEGLKYQTDSGERIARIQDQTQRALGFGNINVQRELGLGDINLRRQLGLGELDARRQANQIERELGLGELAVRRRAGEIERELGLGQTEMLREGNRLNYKAQQRAATAQIIADAMNRRSFR